MKGGEFHNVLSLDKELQATDGSWEQELASCLDEHPYWLSKNTLKK